MKLFEFINLGGPINWALFCLLCFCVCQCLERCFYMLGSFGHRKNGVYTRIERKAEEVRNLPERQKRQALEKEATLLYHEMNRGLWFLNFTGAVAPSVGLLGTVVGLIGAFQGMSKAGSQVNMEDLSGGIWVAMLTTAFGMMISIPALFFYRTFKRIIEKRVMKINLIIEEAMAESSVVECFDYAQQPPVETTDSEK